MYNLITNTNNDTNNNTHTYNDDKKRSNSDTNTNYNDTTNSYNNDTNGNLLARVNDLEKQLRQLKLKLLSESNGNSNDNDNGNSNDNSNSNSNSISISNNRTWLVWVSEWTSYFNSGSNSKTSANTYKQKMRIYIVIKKYIMMIIDVDIYLCTYMFQIYYIIDHCHGGVMTMI